MGKRAQTGHTHTKKTHSFERTHILDSKVALTHHTRNDAGRESGEGIKESGEEEKHIYRGEVFPLQPLGFYFIERFTSSQ